MMTPYDRVAELDQLAADLREWAKVYAAFLRALIEEGIGHDEAVHIVLGWQEGMMQIQAATSAATVYRGEGI